MLFFPAAAAPKRPSTLCSRGLRSPLSCLNAVDAYGSSAFGFEGFTLDMPRRLLRTVDHDVELRPKSFDVLCCLVERAGHLVTKDEILRTVWPGLNVTDDSLTRCVSDIRLSLGDREQRIVKTLPGRGYILAVPISRLAPDSGRAQAANGQPEPAALPLPDRPSTAVLPVDNVDRDPEQ